MKYSYFILVLFISLAFTSCIEEIQEKDELPVYGSKEILVQNENGEEVIDNITLKINDFEVMDQDSQIITQADFKNKIYIVDFFFTHCPTICPVMTKNMALVYDEFESDSDILFLSHTIDIKNDSVPQLKKIRF